MADSKVALQSFVGKVDGVDVVIRNGELIAADHPAVKKWPQFFGEPIQQHEAAPPKRGR